VQFCVLHNTSEPTLAQRPAGLTIEHIHNLESFYRDTQHWSAGPHLFVDQNGIWVFTPLTVPGVHSPSWNRCSWGIEMLGEYETEAFDSGPGAQVAHNAVCALATLHAWANLDSHSLRFHKEDVRTTHQSCPGRNVVKADVIQRVHDLILLRRAPAPVAGAPTAQQASTTMPDAAPFAGPRD
jgi:hypothetical protein